MPSRRQQLKQRAVSMRRHGASIRDIEKRLGVRRSTLSYWFTKVPLSKYHLKLLKKRADNALVKARVEAVKWHNAQKTARMRRASDEAAQTIARIDFTDGAIAELALALLYLGEGAKRSVMTAIGNSDPLILRFFVRMLQRLYQIPPTDMKCELHLRSDQDAKKITRYWSRVLGIPTSNFGKPSFDQRTVGRPTYSHYKGVCIVRCSRVAIQRKLVYIATTFCSRIAESGGG
ncbi:MAG: hypothetical protein Q7S05_01070 [bacterium]|nr:hypothetical protein [bacterium]